MTWASHFNKGKKAMNELSTLNNVFEYVNENGLKINGLSNINNTLSVHYIVYRVDNLVNGKYYIG